MVTKSTAKVLRGIAKDTPRLLHLGTVLEYFFICTDVDSSCAYKTSELYHGYLESMSIDSDR